MSETAIQAPDAHERLSPTAELDRMGFSDAAARRRVLDVLGSAFRPQSLAYGERPVPMHVRAATQQSEILRADKRLYEAARRDALRERERCIAAVAKVSKRAVQKLRAMPRWPEWRPSALPVDAIPQDHETALSAGLDPDGPRPPPEVSANSRYERCPDCDTALRWNYRTQICDACGHGKVKPTMPEGMAPSVGALDVLRERERMIAKGWTAEHDDRHRNGELAAAAACYAQPARTIPRDAEAPAASGWRHGAGFLRWPWHRSWLKPCAGREALVIGAALMLAEIDRLDRLAARQELELREGARHRKRAPATEPVTAELSPDDSAKLLNSMIGMMGRIETCLALRSWIEDEQVRASIDTLTDGDRDTLRDAYATRKEQLPE